MRKLPALVAMVVVGTALSCSLWHAKADDPKPENTTSASNDGESIEVRLARAHLDLASLNLRRAVDVNKRIPNVVPAAFIENLRLHVVIDEEQLKHCLNGEHIDSHEMCVRRAEAEVKIVEADVKRTSAIHRRMQTTTSKLDLERSTVMANIAKLNLERARDPEHSESTLTHLQWQIDELRHHVLELQMEIAARP